MLKNRSYGQSIRASFYELRALDSCVSSEASVSKLDNPAWPKPNQQVRTEHCIYQDYEICRAKREEDDIWVSYADIKGSQADAYVLNSKLI